MSPQPEPPSTAEASPVALSSLAIGHKARISRYDSAIIPPAQMGRFFEMGLTKGAEVEIIRFAPMGDPIDIKVRGYHLSIRKREAAGILVTTDFLKP